MIVNELMPYTCLKDYRDLFVSKEWLAAYYGTFLPEKMIFVKSLQNASYFVMEVTNMSTHFLGDPFNDYNRIEIPNDDLVELFKFIKSLVMNDICISCFTNKLSISSKVYREDIGLKWQSPDMVILSSKLLRMYNREASKINFNRVTPSDEIFTFLLDRLLDSRIKNLRAKDLEGNDASVNEMFSMFIKSLCGNITMINNVFIDYCCSEGEVVSIGLNFMHGKSILYYLRWCYHGSNRCSYGLVHDIMSMSKNRSEGYRVIDYARGNEPYKYRLGLSEYNLFNYEF